MKKHAKRDFEKQEKNQRNLNQVMSEPLNLQGQGIEIPSDVLGSYTGVPEDWDEIPVQDVDDL